MESEIKQIFSKINYLKRSLVLFENATNEETKNYYHLELHKAVLTLELTARNLQKQLNEKRS